MSDAAFVDELREAGFGEHDARSRAALIETADAGFRRFVPEGPRWRWCVPGRIEILGKHTDYAGGHSLLAAVPRGFAVVVRERQDLLVRVIDARHAEVAVIDAADDQKAWRGWPNYAAVVVRRLVRNFPGASLGADIAIASDLPRAAGLSSSSALVVGVATALVRRAALDERSDWRHEITSAQDLAWYLGCVENGLTYRGLAGSDGVGTHGGSEDHTAILTCRPDVVSHYGFVPVRHISDAAMPADWCFAVASSGIHADKAGSVRERFNRASLDTRALLATWNRLTNQSASSLGAALTGTPGAADRLSAEVDVDLHRRLRHFLAEDARVPQAAAAFAAADRLAIGALASASQGDAETLLGNQIPETVALAKAAMSCGAFAASSFGAGFGGSVWALVSADEVERFGAAWVEQYRAQHPRLTKVEWFAARPGPAVVELHSSEAL